MLGKRALHYQIVGKIGGGGMGVVWKALDTSLEREVALKFLPAAATVDPARRERFLREAKAASALNHPNIVTIHEINSESGELFIAMELVRGRSLSAVLRERGRLPPGTAVSYAIQLCAGLGAAHRAGIIHRDIKPSNIMLTDDGLVKILDFGLAKLTAPADAACPDSPITMEGTAVGTVPYMSPEQASGDAVDPRSDIFSVGIVLYEMLGGARPFQGTSNAEILRAVLSSDPPPLASLAPDVPAALIAIVERCLQKSPEARPRDGHDLAACLRAMEHVSAPSPASFAATVTINPRDPPRRPWTRRRNFYLAAGLLVLALGGVWRWRSSAAHTPAGIAAQHEAETLQRVHLLLQRYDRKGNVDTAIALLEPLSARPGAAAALHASLAEAFVRKYNQSRDPQWLPKALEAGRRAVDTTPDLAAAHIALGMALAAGGRTNEAAAAFQRARELNPLSGPAHVGLARLSSGSDAVLLLQKAISLSPGDWIPYNELGALYFRQARYSDSVTAWREAVRLAPGNVMAIRNLGAALHMEGDYAEAADKLQGALELDESDATTWANLATARYFQGSYADAVRAAEKSVELAPGSYKYWGNLGDAYRWAPGLRGKAPAAYHNAIRLVRDQIKLAPAPALRVRLAAYLAKSGDPAAGMRELAGSLKAIDRDSGSLFSAAVTCELAADRQSALDVLGRAIAAGYSMHEVTHEPELAALRTDPRFLSFTAAGRGKK